jgi:5-methylthioadenosine/S-adenosylhomocysteine deaminase
MARTLLRAHTLITQSTTRRELQPGGLVIEDGAIARVGPLAELEQQGPYDTVLGDPHHHLAMPGFVNAHHHSLRPARIGVPASPLETWLVRWRERQLPPLTEQDAYDHTLWGTLQMLRSGVTGVVDHFPFDAHLADLGVPAAVQAYQDAGVRAAVCLPSADQHRFVYDDDEVFLASVPAGISAVLRQRLRPFDQDAYFTMYERLAARFDGAAGRIRIGFAPVGPQWCSGELLRRIRRVADEHGNAPVQIHLLETRYQALYGYRRYGHSLTRHLANLDFFGTGTSCAHCVWVSQDDIGILADAGVVAVHNPSSNLLLSSGIAPVADMLDAGVRVGFGLDAAGLNDAQDILTDLRLGLLLQRRPGWTGRPVAPTEMIGLATQGGSTALGRSAPIGRLEEGYRADVVLVDRTRLYESPYVNPAAPAEDALLRRAEARDVDLVMVDGRVLLEDGAVVGIDETALRQRIAESLERTYQALSSADSLFDQLEPHIVAFYKRWDQESAHLLPPHYQFNTR